LATYGATFLPDYNPAKRRLPDSLGGGPREDRYRFCWTPTNSMASSIPYYFTISGKDKRCPNPGRTSLSFSIQVSPKPSISIQKSMDSCGRLHLSFTNNNPTVPIGQYVWEVQLHEKPATRKTYANINSAIHLIKDTGRYDIKLVLFPGTASNLSCSSVAIDSLYATGTSLYDSLVIHHPTCSNKNDGSIEVGAFNGTQPYQFAIDGGAWGSNNLFTGLPIGLHTIRLKDASGCEITREVHLEKPLLLPNGIWGMDKVFVGDSALYGCALKPGNTAIWTVVNGTILSDPNTYFVWVKWNTTGTGEVQLIASDSACSDTATIMVTIGNTGIPKLTNPMGIHLYPNPTHSVLTIQANKIDPNTTIQLYNTIGKLVMEKELTANQQINLESFPNGLYFVKVGDWHTSVVKE
jgi:hypothetical protein